MLSSGASASPSQDGSASALFFVHPQMTQWNYLSLISHPLHASHYSNGSLEQPARYEPEDVGSQPALATARPATVSR